ncbi:MAG TPA: 2'-5' RNA ligase family protein [Candidatus Limnocylindria bacterium]|nr:2'-5' RNA ligase family protein [Candidatus Limnocylindria bacterium]
MMGYGKASAAFAREHPVIAINVALDPDAAMIARANAANARLIETRADGFALDETHAPHLSLLHRYVRTAALDDVHAAVARIVADLCSGDWTLTARAYSGSPWRDVFLANIVVESTDALHKLQQALIDAIIPFTVEAGSAAAFVTTSDEREIDQPTIDYVTAFVPDATGSRFTPHVTVGIASEAALQGLLAEPFDRFTFSPSRISVYQLGSFGTARKKLASWKLPR